MRNKSILLVDDEEIIRNSIGRDLKEENYTVTLATSGEEAIDLLNDTPFDLVLTDLSMSGLTGIQVLKEAKVIAPMTGVIILTGYGDMASAIDCLRFGADDYLLKPYDFDELMIRIERFFEKQTAFQKIKLYENILPVCMYCKSIRDDTGTDHGRGRWRMMEDYIYHTSGTDISHTFCPECQDKAEKDMFGNR